MSDDVDTADARQNAWDRADRADRERKERKEAASYDPARPWHEPDAFDLLPQRIHDSDPDERTVEAMFTPWHKDVYELARLLRWLELVDEVPRDIPLFLETALSWSDAYDRMNEAIGK